MQIRVETWMLDTEQQDTKTGVSYIHASPPKEIFRNIACKRRP